MLWPRPPRWRWRPSQLLHLRFAIAAYKGKHYPGEHEGIVSQEIWGRVQEHLQNGDRRQKGPLADRASKAPSLLRGLLFSDQNRAFTPGYTQRGAKFYRYYINTDAIKLGKTGCEIQRLPAGEIETVVVEKLRHVLRSPEVLAHAVREVADLRPKIKESESIRALQSIDPVWDELFPSEQAGIVRTLVDRITVRRDGITIQWKDQGMNKLLRETLTAPAAETA